VFYLSYIAAELRRRKGRTLLTALGVDVDTENRRGTPGRVARAYAEMFTPRAFNLTTFPNDDGYDELIVARAIPFHSLCMHHLLPFHGVAHVGYLPGERIIGLSKLARVVDMFARDLQVQEGLTKQIAARIREYCSPRHVPNEVHAIAEVPRTLSGKILEVPVKKILMGTPPEQAASRESLANPQALDAFVTMAQHGS